MFSSGARVYVHSSSVSGKKLGPKPHSLGFVSMVSNCNIIDGVADFPIPKQKFIVCPMDIIFTRFGREQRERSENKHILAIMPAFFETKGINVHEQVDEMLDLFTDRELCKNENWRDLAGHYGASSVAVLLPVRGKVSSLGANDVWSYASSLLRNHAFSSLIRSNYQLPTLTKLFPQRPDLFKWTAAACGSSSSSTSLRRWAEESGHHMNELLIFMRAVSAAFNKANVENGLKWANEHMDVGGMGMDTFLTWFLEGIYDGEKVMLQKINLAKKGNRIHSKLSNLIDCTRLVRASYLNLKLKYV